MNNFDEYLDFSEEEDKEKQLKIMSKIKLSDATAEKIKKINKNIEFLIFAEPYCPDCRAFVPFMEQFTKLNPHIIVSYLSRTKDGELLSSVSPEARIPSMFYRINGKYFIAYLEMPKFIIEKINNGGDPGELKYEYRPGVYNKEIEDELLNIILDIEKQI